MPGFPQDSCEYNNCKYRIPNGSYRYVDYYNSISGVIKDTNLVGSYRTGPCSFVTWDKIPQE